MKINVFGLGYVGNITAICLASLGHEVLGIEVIAEKVAKLNSGELPIFEPELDELLQSVRDKSTEGSFRATQELGDEFELSTLSIICVGTPSKSSGDVDLNQIKSTICILAERLKKSNTWHDIVIRSTIPPQTTKNILIPLIEEKSGKKVGEEIGVSFYPEFMREGLGVKDFFSPSLNIVGCVNEKSFELIANAFKLEKKATPSEITTAEMIKYANNSFHALKVCFANEIGTLCKAYGVDSEELTELFLSDKKLNISDVYLRPGFAYGGACLPKELRGIRALFDKKNIHAPLISAIQQSNSEHITRFTSILEESDASKVGFIGVTFKPDTDDTRESPLLISIDKLLTGPSYKTKRNFFLYDRPIVLEKIKEIYGTKIHCFSSISQLLELVDIVVLGPQKLSEKDSESLLDFKGKIIDLKWNSLPTSVTNKVNYTSIC